MGKEHYRRRAAECLKFAKVTHDEEERELMLIRAKLLQRLAGEREITAQQTSNDLNS